jgi:hypothetical protein
MKIQLSTLVKSYPALQRLARERMSARTAFQVQRALVRLEPEFRLYEQARLQLIREKYGKPDSSGDLLTVPPEKVHSFLVELDDLLGMELEVDLQPVALGEDTLISPADLHALDWMVTVPGG